MRYRGGTRVAEKKVFEGEAGIGILEELALGVAGGGEGLVDSLDVFTYFRLLHNGHQCFTVIDVYNLSGLWLMAQE